MLDERYVATEACPVKVTCLGKDDWITIYFFFVHVLKWCGLFHFNNLLGLNFLFNLFYSCFFSHFFAPSGGYWSQFDFRCDLFLERIYIEELQLSVWRSTIWISSTLSFFWTLFNWLVGHFLNPFLSVAHWFMISLRLKLLWPGSFINFSLTSWIVRVDISS